MPVPFLIDTERAMANTTFRTEVKALQELSRDALEGMAMQWVHNRRDRSIVLERLLEGTKYEALAEEFDLSPTRIKEIVRNGVHRIAAHI